MLNNGDKEQRVLGCVNLAYLYMFPHYSIMSILRVQNIYLLHTLAFKFVAYMTSCIRVCCSLFYVDKWNTKPGFPYKYSQLYHLVAKHLWKHFCDVFAWNKLVLAMCLYNFMKLGHRDGTVKSKVVFIHGLNIIQLLFKCPAESVMTGSCQSQPFSLQRNGWHGCHLLFTALSLEPLA